jgi:hypothetical protein
MNNTAVRVTPSGADSQLPRRVLDGTSDISS